jgi:hypothetical protein
MYPDREKLALGKKFEPLYGGFGMNYGLEAVTGEGPPLRRWKLLFKQPSTRLAELAAVGALILPSSSNPTALIGSPQPVLVQRFSGLPRAIVVPEAIVVPPGQAVAATLDEKLDPKRTAILEEGEPLQPDPSWITESGSVRLIARRAGKLELLVKVPTNAVLIVFNTFEKGWQARVDARVQPVLAADAAFQGIRLAPGEHVVELRYRPRGLATGIAAAGIGVLALVLCAFRLADG